MTIDRTYFLPRTDLARIFGNPVLVRQFETLQETVATSAEASTAAVEATQSQREATYVTLSANSELPNERVLSVGPGMALEVTPTQVKVVSNLYSDSGWTVQMNAVGATEVQLPTSGILATRGGAETFTNKTLAAPKLSGLVNAADDAAAAAGSVPVGGIYHNAGSLRVRLS